MIRDPTERTLARSTASAAFGMSLAVFSFLSGCMSLQSADGCPDHASEDFYEVEKEVNRPWSKKPDEEGRFLGVLALRTSPPEPPQDDNDTYVIWRDISEGARPAIIHDMLCFSIWRQEHIPTLTKAPYWTQSYPNNTVGERAMNALHEAYERQNNVPDPEEWVYLLFQDQWFVAGFRDTHITPR